MAQGNGPGPRTGGYPPQRGGAAGQEQHLDPRQAGHLQGQPGHNPAGQYSAQDPHSQQPVGGYSPSQPVAAGGRPQQGFGAQPAFQQPHGAGQPHPSQQAQYDPQYGGPPPQGDPNAYAPQFSPYVPPSSDPNQPQHYPTHGAPPEAQAPHYEDTPVTGEVFGHPQTMENPAFPAQPQGQYYEQHDPNTGAVAPVPNENGMYGAPQEEWSNAAPPTGAHGYDAGGYVGGQPGQSPGQPDYLAQPEYQTQADAQYAGNPAGGFAAPGEHGADPFGVQPGVGYPEDPAAQAGAVAGAAGSEFDDGYDYEDYEGHDGSEVAAGGMSRPLLIVGALVGAIVVGGSLAYGWKIISGPSGDGAKIGATPVVRSGSSPTKTRPTNPGGQKFDHADSKLLGRLGDGGAKRSATDANGTKKVPTVTVSRDGSVRAPASAPTPPAQTGGQPTVSVPGLMVVDAFGTSGGDQGSAAKPIVVSRPQPKSGAKTESAVVTKPRVEIRNAPKKPVVISKATTKTTAPAVKKKVAPTVKKSVDVARRAPVVPKKKASTSVASKGFVVVLASVPASSNSRMAALMQYADLQQKYGNLLGSKTPDVREANLGSKGKYHRLLVGPPGSRSQASNLCAKLKSAGYSGCWVTSY